MNRMSFTATAAMAALLSNPSSAQVATEEGLMAVLSEGNCVLPLSEAGAVLGGEGFSEAFVRRTVTQMVIDGTAWVDPGGVLRIDDAICPMSNLAEAPPTPRAVIGEALRGAPDCSVDEGEIASLAAGAEEDTVQAVLAALEADGEARRVGTRVSLTGEGCPELPAEETLADEGPVAEAGVAEDEVVVAEQGPSAEEVEAADASGDAVSDDAAQDEDVVEGDGAEEAEMADAAPQDEPTDDIAAAPEDEQAETALAAAEDAELIEGDVTEGATEEVDDAAEEGVEADVAEVDDTAEDEVVVADGADAEAPGSDGTSEGEDEPAVSDDEVVVAEADEAPVAEDAAEAADVESADGADVPSTDDVATAQTPADQGADQSDTEEAIGDDDLAETATASAEDAPVVEGEVTEGATDEVDDAVEAEAEGEGSDEAASDEVAALEADQEPIDNGATTETAEADGADDEDVALAAQSDSATAEDVDATNSESIEGGTADAEVAVVDGVDPEIAGDGVIEGAGDEPSDAAAEAAEDDASTESAIEAAQAVDLTLPERIAVIAAENDCEVGQATLLDALPQLDADELRPAVVELIEAGDAEVERFTLRLSDEACEAARN